MADSQLLTAALSQFARTLAQGFAIGDVLHDLVERVTVVLGVDCAGVSVQDSGELRFVTAVSEQAAILERAQEALQAGPWTRGGRAWQSSSPTCARSRTGGAATRRRQARPGSSPS